MAYDNNYGEKKNDTVHSLRLKAGKKRTYFFDVKSSKGNDYFLSITESVRRFNDDGYDRHKIIVYKEDFNKFVKGLTETVDHIKTNLLPDFDFDAFAHEYNEDGVNTSHFNGNPAHNFSGSAENNAAPSGSESVDSW